MQIMQKLMTSVLAGLLLAACGGGGGGGGGGGSAARPFGPGPDIGAIRTLTSSAPSEETIADQSSRSTGIFSRADSLVMSTAYGETSSSQLPTFSLSPSCSGKTCSFVERRTEYSVTLGLSNVDFTAESNSQPVGTKHGITLVRSTGFLSGINFRTLGAWTQHSAFAVRVERGTFEDVRLDTWHSMAGGKLTSSRPSGSATWQGLMVGTPTAGENRGNRLQGDATLSYSLDDSTLNAAFTDIKNIDNLKAHSVPTVRFTGVPVDAQGEFQTGSAGNLIQGGFYGPGHAEAAGIFEKSNIVGAFGAKKQ